MRFSPESKPSLVWFSACYELYSAGAKDNSMHLVHIHKHVWCMCVYFLNPFYGLLKYIVGETQGQIFGKTQGQVFGKTQGQIVGETQGQILGKTHGQIASKTYVQIVGGTQSQIVGEIHGHITHKFPDP